MAYNTRKYDARMRIKKAAEDRQGEMFERAVKGISPRIEINPDHPRASVVVLTNYLTRLEVLRDDLHVEFGDLPEFISAAGWINQEIRLALSALVKLRIKIEAGS